MLKSSCAQTQFVFQCTHWLAGADDGRAEMDKQLAAGICELGAILIGGCIMAVGCGYMIVLMAAGL